MIGIQVSQSVNNRPHSINVFLFTTILLLNNTNKVVSGQAIIPLLQPNEEGTTGNDSVLRSFLEPCEVVTIQTQCTEDEYEDNEDCLPQKKDNCDRSKELFCLSGVCLPNCHPHKETYDHVEGRCFRKVGSDCKLKAQPTQFPHLLQHENSNNEAEEEEDEGRLSQRHSTTVIVPECEKNAVCEKGQCKCAKKFTYNHNFSKCMFSASYAEYCNETTTCDRKSDVFCKEHQCQCKSPEIQYFHLKRKRCYIEIGQVCSTGLQFCPDNSSCVRNNVTGGREQEKDNNGNNDVLLFTSSVVDDQQQHHDDDDRNSTAADGNYRLRLFYQEQQSNRYHTGRHKDVEDEHFIGIWGDEEEEGNEFLCKCIKGFGSTRDKRFCLGLHGTRCNTLHRCNMERGLKCVDGVCLCDRERGNEQIFSEQFQTCITRIGAQCTDDGKGYGEEDICPIGASCKNEKCTCDKGLVASSNQSTSSIAYSCMKSHGMFCKSNRNIASSSSSSNISSFLPQGIAPFEPPCNHEIGLECNRKEAKCLCRDSNQFYEARQRACQNVHGIIDEKIPVSPFTPPNDREYNFHKKNSGGGGKYTGKLSRNLGVVLLILRYF